MDPEVIVVLALGGGETPVSVEEEPTHEEERGSDGACESETLTRATVFTQGFIREPE